MSGTRVVTRALARRREEIDSRRNDEWSSAYDSLPCKRDLE